MDARAFPHRVESLLQPPVGKLHKSNRAIIETADKMGRAPIQMPDKLAEPAAEFLEYHREAIFIR